MPFSVMLMAQVGIAHVGWLLELNARTFDNTTISLDCRCFARSTGTCKPGT